MRSSSPFVLVGARRLAAAGALAVGAAGGALAQMPKPAPPVDAIDPRHETRNQQQREAGLRSAELVVFGARTDPREVEAAVAKVKGDFARLQVLRNDIVRRLAAGERPDYKAFARTAAEINKRANRLKTLLVLYGPETAADKQRAEPAEVDGDHMSRALVTLCKTIDRFVESPVFDLQGVIDVDASAKAGGDLLSIIDLSEGIRRGAERLGKRAK
jgi:hypothetical protein